MVSIDCCNNKILSVFRGKCYNICLDEREERVEDQGAGTKHPNGCKEERQYMREKFRVFMSVPIVMTLLLAIANISILFYEQYTNEIMAGVFVFFLLLTLVLTFICKPRFLNSMTEYATSYGILQRHLLNEFEVPYALLDNDGKILWSNERFMSYTKTSKKYHKSIANTELYCQ